MSINEPLILTFLNIIFTILILMIGIALLLKADLLQSFNLEGYSNDYCQTIKNKEKNNLDYLICDNKYKKSKIILLLIDALAYDQLLDLNNLSNYKITNFFKAEGLDYKQSGSLFESIFTGKFSRNYLASQIKIDNMAQQFKKANMKIYYKARNFPLDTLIDKKFADIFELYKGENYLLKNLCNNGTDNIEILSSEIKEKYIDNTHFCFKKGLTVEDLYNYSNEKLKNSFNNSKNDINKCFKQYKFYSFIYFTEIMDHFNHVFYKYHPINRFNVYYLEKIIKQLINWINEEHSEYALVLGSDHGGQYYYGEDTLCNHGCNNPGNEGIFFIYTKELGDNYNKLNLINNKEDIPIISINDYSCTMAQILKNVNLPLESTCTPRVVGNDKLLKFTSAKSKEIQLKMYIEKLYKKYQKLDNHFKEIYYTKLEKNKFSLFFKSIKSIYEADDEFYEKYMEFLIDLQTNLNNDVKKLGQSTIYYLVFNCIILFFCSIFFYTIKNIISLTKKKCFKIFLIQNLSEKIILKDTFKYILMILPILFIDDLMLVIFMNSSYISEVINISVFIKIFFILFFLFIIYFINKNKNKINKLRKIIFIIIIIILIHYIMDKIKFFSILDRNVDTQKKLYLCKYISYFLILTYSCFELYFNKNYYISKKYNIRYIYIIILYMIILSYFIIKCDLFFILHAPANPPQIITLLKIIYILILILPLFIKPLIKINNNKMLLSKKLINFKLFILVLVLFVSTEIDRLEMIPLYCFVLYYLTYSFVKEDELFFKLLYIIIINIYPNLHFIGNQGTYTLDTSIKITPKSPSAYADDRPIIMGILFVVHKFKFFLIYVGYIYSITNGTRNKLMNYYTTFIRLFQNAQLYAVIICFLIYLKYEKENSYVQILFLIGTKALVVLFFDIIIFINYFFYKFLNYIYRNDEKIIFKKEISIEEEKRDLKIISSL